MKAKVNYSLEAAIARLIAKEARFIERFERMDERMGRIELLLMRLLEVLPDALRAKIGIQPQKE